MLLRLRISSAWDKLLRLYPPQAKPAPAIWTATNSNLNYLQTALCQRRHISVDQLQRPIRSAMHHSRAHHERIACTPDVDGRAGSTVTAIYTTQFTKNDIFLYVEGGWISSWLFDVSSSDPDYAAALRTIAIRVCPAALPAKVRAQALPLGFFGHGATTMLPFSTN